MFSIRIKTDSAAFGSNSRTMYSEIVRILNDVQKDVRENLVKDDEKQRHPIRDFNGNKIGHWYWDLT